MEHAKFTPFQITRMTRGAGPAEGVMLLLLFFLSKQKTSRKQSTFSPKFRFFLQNFQKLKNQNFQKSRSWLSGTDTVPSTVIARLIVPATVHDCAVLYLGSAYPLPTPAPCNARVILVLRVGSTDIQNLIIICELAFHSKNLSIS